MKAAALALLLAVRALAADKAQIQQDITVRAKAAGPALSVPPPAAAKPVIDEVLGSLSFGRAAPETAPITRVEPDAARVAGLFPEPPFLAFSPAHVRARYDDWTFEVFDGDKSLWRVDGVGPARAELSWDGRGTDGRLAAAAGRSYRYRFTGRRGGKVFMVESDPLALPSLSLREYVGEERLEAGVGLLFAAGSAELADSSGRFLREMCARLRAADKRQDGSYRFELYAAQPRGKLARSRAKALTAALAEGLRADPGDVQLLILPAERGESFAAFVPVSRGPALKVE